MWARIFRTAPALALMLLAMLAASRASGQVATRAASFADWIVYRHGAGAERTCFALSQPTVRQGQSAEGVGSYVMVSAWPRHGVKAQPSIYAGAPFRGGSSVSITIKGDTFTLFTDGDRAFVDDPTMELKLVDAMKKGNTMLVRGVLASGGQMFDTYSLSGVTQAVNAVSQDCG
ncbi:MAG: invasion associated locus B family protein [Hyphomicrobiaceae bacterium]